MIKVILAEDHLSLVDGIKLYMEKLEDIKVLSFVNNGKDLVNSVERRKPDVVVVDIRMPILDGVVATKFIKKRFPEIKVISFTMFDQPEAVGQMLAAGADGYILKNSHLEELAKAIRSVYKGEKYFDAQMSIPVGTGPKKSKDVLTKREWEILRLIALGKSNLEIGEELFIGGSTVATHRKNMILKLGLKGKGELLRYAMERKYDF